MSAKEGPPMFPLPISSSNKYRCSACEAVFTSQNDLEEHMKTAHPEETETESAQQLRIKHLEYTQKRSKSRRKK